jgi:hypothetical protein
MSTINRIRAAIVARLISIRAAIVARLISIRDIIRSNIIRAIEFARVQANRFIQWSINVIKTVIEGVHKLVYLPIINTIDRVNKWVQNQIKTWR